MRFDHLARFSRENPHILIVDSLAKGLHYLFDDDKSIFAVSGIGNDYKDNTCIVTTERAQEIASQIKKDGCLPCGYDDRHYVFSGTNGEVVLNQMQADAFCEEFEGMIDYREASSGVKYELSIKKGA